MIDLLEHLLTNAETLKGMGLKPVGRVNPKKNWLGRSHMAEKGRNFALARRSRMKP